MDSLERINFQGGGTRAPIDHQASYHLICPNGLKHLAMIYQEGEEKYPFDNGFKGSTYVRGLPFDNTINHIINHVEIARKGGDQEGGPVIHLAKAAWGCFSLIHFLTHCKHHRIAARLEAMVHEGWDGDFGKEVK